MIDTKNCKFSNKWLEVGRKIEMEHTNDPYVARTIAKQHLCESPLYYKYLQKMEIKLKRLRRK